MPLIYSSVSKGTVTVAEYAAFSGNFSSVAKEFLEKAGKNEGKFTYSVDGHTFNFLAKGGFSESPCRAAFGTGMPCKALPIAMQLNPMSCCACSLLDGGRRGIWAGHPLGVPQQDANRVRRKVRGQGKYRQRGRAQFNPRVSTCRWKDAGTYR